MVRLVRASVYGSPGRQAKMATAFKFSDPRTNPISRMRLPCVASALGAHHALAGTVQPKTDVFQLFCLPAGLVSLAMTPHADALPLLTCF